MGGVESMYFYDRRARQQFHLIQFQEEIKAIGLK